MATTIQHRRGTTAEHVTFTGAVGEVTYNTTTKSVHTHDGVTAGGFPLIKASDLSADTGAGLVGYLPAGTGAVATTVEGKLHGTVISVFDFMTDVQRTDAMSATPTVDCTAAIQAAVNHALTLPGRVTIEGYGLCVISGTVSLTSGVARKPIYFTAGGYKKINSGLMFSSTVDDSGEVYFDSVYFESTSGAGTKIFSTDYIIRLHTTNCVFRNCDYVWYSGDDTAALGYAYSQSCRSFGDTVTGGAGYAFDLASVFDCIWNGITIEARDSGIRVRTGGLGCHSVSIVNSVFEGLSGKAITLESPLTACIENNYFELNAQANITFTTSVGNVVLKSNTFAGPDNSATADYGVIWPISVAHATCIGNLAINIALHNVTALDPVSIIWSYQERNGSGKALDNSKILIHSSLTYSQATVGTDMVTTSHMGQFQRLTVQQTKTVPNGATTDYVADFGVSIRTDDFVSIQCNTAADVRLLKYRKSGNTIIYTVRNDTGSSQSTTFTLCVMKPYYSVIG